MSKYIDKDFLLTFLKEKLESYKSKSVDPSKYPISHIDLMDFLAREYQALILQIESLQHEQPMPDSTQLIAEWGKEKAVLEQKDFRGDAERMAYNAFMDGFAKGLGYKK